MFLIPILSTPALYKMLLVQHCSISELKNLTKQLHLTLEISLENTKIPGSFWGDDEAGLIDDILYVNPNTPIHSLLHEACHFICMDENRRNDLDTNAGGDYDEENAVCYLQIILSNLIPEMGNNRMFQDMDDWGYTFRLGSAQKWFENDADDAYNWLINHQLIDHNKQYLFILRKK